MKRSHINRQIAAALDFLREHGFALPPFAYWCPERWRSVGPEADELRSHKLGWDVTDFGSGRFDEVGSTAFTIRNGRLEDAENRKIYAEKILIVGEAQKTPFHLHHEKTEDIINRGGGRLVVELYNSDDRNELAGTPVTASCDGVRRTVPAGGSVIMSTGERITLVPGLYHQFAGEVGSGTVLVGEVSSVNDDAIDNHFLAGLPRFPSIEEDEPATHLLSTEYPPPGD